MSAARRKPTEEELAAERAEQGRWDRSQRVHRDMHRLATFLQGILCLYEELDGEIGRRYEEPDTARRQVAGVIDHTRLLRDQMNPDDGSGWSPPRDEVRATLKLLARLALSTLDDEEEAEKAASRGLKGAVCSSMNEFDVKLKFKTVAHVDENNAGRLIEQRLRDGGERFGLADEAEVLECVQVRDNS